MPQRQFLLLLGRSRRHCQPLLPHFSPIPQPTSLPLDGEGFKLWYVVPGTEIGNALPGSLPGSRQLGWGGGGGIGGHVELAGTVSIYDNMALWPGSSPTLTAPGTSETPCAS